MFRVLAPTIDVFVGFGFEVSGSVGPCAFGGLGSRGQGLVVEPCGISGLPPRKYAAETQP